MQATKKHLPVSKVDKCWISISTRTIQPEAYALIYSPPSCCRLVWLSFRRETTKGDILNIRDTEEPQNAKRHKKV